ncbi:MAG: hypothetical protein ONB48_17965 [candidate division KSB1 bacterium]|nr:hypothetical protein [candidate division KSB1 bacterium]MDZ7275777.1 hypothetical protein [candidate division KSB1 bacterium]MDZ7287530.1 hypothetical protein [candidate division KSB1 bacterium]MDZ7309142.1 hypothetical protein [candidate division KSB1 bacterium]MDZ7350508.1 hypothetical protein [candidate division KSB1 bacterium]
MKRFMILLAAAMTTVLLVGILVEQSQSHPVPNRQFHGKATYRNNEPARVGTSVDAWLGSVKIADGEVWDTRGSYNIWGENSDFPSGTYTLVADDGSLLGQVNVYHAQGTDTYVDVVLDTAY